MARAAGPTGVRAMLAGSREHPVPAAVATLVGFTNGAAMVFGAVAVGHATDTVVIPGLAGEGLPSSAWWTSATAILAISLVRWVTIVVRGMATGRVQFGAQAETRRRLVHRYLDLDLGWHRRHSPGRLLAHAVSDVDALWSPLQWFYFALGMVVMMVIAFVQLFTRDPMLGWLGVVLIVTILGLNLLYQRLLTPRIREVQAARGQVAAVAHESIDGGPVVRSLGLAAGEADRFAPAVERLRRAATRSVDVSSVMEPILELLPTGVVLTALALGASRVSSGSLTVGDLVSVVYLMLTISMPLNVVSRFLALLPLSAAGGERVHAVLADEAGRKRYGAARLTHDGPLEVCVEHATVELGGAVLLHRAEVTLPAGSVTAVVGSTGAGKTTLIDVLGGQLHPQCGTVRFDGIDVRDLARGEVPAAVGVVSQAPFLFAESIRDNLVLDGDPRDGRPYTEQEIWAALRRAAVDDLVRSLPNGLDTLVGERGATLSGGQRQRLCLARAVLRRPRLLILDDATSALDPAVEQQVLAGLADLAREGGTTLLLVANRPAGLALADRVVLLRSGRVAAQGTHHELLAAEADYRSIVTAYDEGSSAA